MWPDVVKKPRRNPIKLPTYQLLLLVSSEVASNKQNVTGRHG